MYELAAEFGCHLALVAVELPPPRDEPDFHALSRSPYMLCYEMFDVP